MFKLSVSIHRHNFVTFFFFDLLQLFWQTISGFQTFEDIIAQVVGFIWNASHKVFILNGLYLIVLYRIPAGDSFFNFNSSNTPKCGEPYIVPTCDCYQGDGDNSINVTCSQPKQSNLLKTSYRCEPPPDTRPPTILKPPAVDENDTATVDPDVLNEGKVPLNTSTTPVVPVWPTPVNKINETHARKICNDALVSSKIYKLCSENTNEGAFGFIVEGCVMDIQVGHVSEFTTYYNVRPYNSFCNLWIGPTLLHGVSNYNNYNIVWS